MPLIHETLRDSAARYPEKECVVCGGTWASYRVVDESSNQLAAYLVSIGVKRGDRVGIFSAKGVEEIIAIFGVLKAGGVFVHINPHFKEGQLSHVVDDCGMRVLLLHASKARILAATQWRKGTLPHVVPLSPDLKLSGSGIGHMHAWSDVFVGAHRKAVPADRLNENDIASIIYTSGSTGEPKGIIVTHGVFHDSTLISAGVLDNNLSDRLISVTPMSFDGALSQLFTAFYSGGTLVQQPSVFPKDVVTTLLEERITGFHSVPSLWGMLLHEQSPFRRYEYPDLRYVSIIGEVLPERFLEELKRLLPETQLYVMYGTTEAFRSTFRVVGDLSEKTGSVGRPFPGVEISIEDDDRSLCAVGQVGEIVHRGAFVSPGYWRDDEKGEEVFVDGAVRTGDLGRLDEDGFLYFEGRKDTLLKTQGYRVSPEEIETCVYRIRAVKEAVVIGVKADDVGVRIKAVIVPQDGLELGEKEVIRHCRSLLPPYMVPSLVEFREALPKTASNKINRSALV
jgi:amino acid adenylation domain-containing protein